MMVDVDVGARLSNSLLDSGRIETLIYFGFACGAVFLAVYRAFGKSVLHAGGMMAKVFAELQRKAFHMIGGCIICSLYHFGLKYRLLLPAFAPCDEDAGSKPSDNSTSRPMDAGVCFLGACLVSWILEASRLMLPCVQKWYLDSFKGLVREKEYQKAAGIAYFLPGSLAAMMAAPSNVAILGILFLSIGDAAASIGTAAGCIHLGASSRKVEGSIGCFVACTLLGAYAGLSAGVALMAAGLVTVGEALAEIIGLDDNFVLPLLGVIGVRLGLCLQIWQLVKMMGTALSIGVVLGAVIGSATPEAVMNDLRKQAKRKSIVPEKPHVRAR